MRAAFLVLAALVFVPGARAALGADGLVLAADDGVAPEERPFRAPVVFRLRAGAADDPLAAAAGPAERAQVRRWQLQLFDFDETKVAWLQGEGAPPAELGWDGCGRDGRPLRDGFYTARVAWLDDAGKPRLSNSVQVGLLTPPGAETFAGPDARLVYAPEGLVIRLSEALTFDPGRAELRPRAEDSLRKIAAFLGKWPRHRLAVIGHADSTGTEEANRALSLRRALVIEAFLRGRGIAPDRMASEGRGASEPLASNDTPEGRARNRRVEIVLLKAAG